MPEKSIATTDSIRSCFAVAVSDMYREEVPAYGTLLDLVVAVNRRVLANNPGLESDLRNAGQLSRISEERHGAVRLGTDEELATMRRLFAVMGMAPVGYYDLSEAGIPAHSTAFRPISEAALLKNPFRVFTSLLRLDLIADKAVRARAAELLAARKIFTQRCLELIEVAETEGGLTADEADEFVQEALKTFRWHARTNVDKSLYLQLHDAHRLVGDVVAFRRPHINHLTPRTLDIDAVHTGMRDVGIMPKAVIEGPPRRACPILLRQTSFKALSETVQFGDYEGTHSARFGEIEARGQALTPKGRALYDRLLTEVRKEVTPAADGSNAEAYAAALSRIFAAFPDDLDTIRRENLGYFEYMLTPKGKNAAGLATANDPEALLQQGYVRAVPITYEDFLPVSAAGIFQSNLGDGAAQAFQASPNQKMFEAAIGTPVLDEFEHYAAIEDASLAQCRAHLNAEASTAEAAREAQDA